MTTTCSEKEGSQRPACALQPLVKTCLGAAAATNGKREAAGRNHEQVDLTTTCREMFVCKNTYIDHHHAAQNIASENITTSDRRVCLQCDGVAGKNTYTDHRRHPHATRCRLQNITIRSSAFCSVMVLQFSAYPFYLTIFAWI